MDTPLILPENVAPMPAEQRQKLKQLAEAATPLNEPWASAYLGEYADYALASGPGVALATLAYVEALEAALKDQGELLASTQLAHNQFADAFRKRRQEWRQEQMQASDAQAKLAARVSELQGELTRAESKHSELRGQVTSMLEDFANGCVAVKMEPGVATTPYWMGVNKERHNNLLWAELKCKELGIAWPIKPIPYASSLPSPPAPTLVAAEPAAEPSSIDLNEVYDYYCTRCGTNELEKDDYEGECGMCGNPKFECMKKGEADALGVKFDAWVESENARRAGAASLVVEETQAEPWRAVFPNEAAYDASVADVCRRIELGEVQPKQQEGGEDE